MLSNNFLIYNSTKLFFFFKEFQFLTSSPKLVTVHFIFRYPGRCVLILHCGLICNFPDGNWGWLLLQVYWPTGYLLLIYCLSRSSVHFFVCEMKFMYHKICHFNHFEVYHSITLSTFSVLGNLQIMNSRTFSSWQK